MPLPVWPRRRPCVAGRRSVRGRLAAMPFPPPYTEGGRDGCCCEQATISQIRTDASINAQTLYGVTDPDRVGWFYPDPSDTTSPDNTGTVLISASGLRLKRCVPLQTLDAKWFGPAGDGGTDDTAAIQAALDAIPPEGGTVWVPHGDYRIDALTGLRPKSRTKLLLDSGAVLRALPHGSERYNVILTASRTDVTVQGGTIVGERGEDGIETFSHNVIRNNCAYQQCVNNQIGIKVMQCERNGLCIHDRM